MNVVTSMNEFSMNAVTSIHYVVTFTRVGCQVKGVTAVFNANKFLSPQDPFPQHRAYGVVVSRLLRMQKASDSIPDMSIADIKPRTRAAYTESS